MHDMIFKPNVACGPEAWWNIKETDDRHVFELGWYAGAEKNSHIDFFAIAKISGFVKRPL